MNTAGSSELGYASAAIVGALLDRLLVRGILSPADASGILNDATRAVSGFGRLAFVPGALHVIGGVKAQLAKHGVS